MVKDLGDATDTEKSSVTSFNELMQAKTKEVNANTKSIESESWSSCVRSHSKGHNMLLIVNRNGLVHGFTR